MRGLSSCALVLYLVITLPIAVGTEIEVANRYFAKRKNLNAAIQLSAARDASRSLIADNFLKIRPNGYVPGEQWFVHLSLRRPPLDLSSLQTKTISDIRFTVLEWVAPPEEKLHLKMQWEGESSGESFVEQRIDFRKGISEFRRCLSELSCGAWISIHSETLRLAGNDGGLGWEQGPILLVAGSLSQAQPNADAFTYESDDFFGRAQGWKWRLGDPWPERYETPQGIATLLPRGRTR